MFSRPDSLFQAIADNASVALLIMDARQHCVFMNPAAVELTGYRLDEIQGRPLHDFVHYLRPDGSPYPLQECPIDRAFPEKNRMRGEEVFVHKDGHLYPVSFTASPLLDESATPIGTIIEVLDISRRREQETREARTRQLFVDLVERAPFGMYIVDAEFRIVLMNEGSKTSAFRNVPDVVGRGLRDAMRVLWPEPVVDEVVALFRRTMDTGEPYFTSEFRNMRQDVKTVEAYEWELQRITLPDGRHAVVCYYFDLTRLRDAEIALREADRAKDQFLAMLAHELRNPLAPIRIAAALQRARVTDDPVMLKSRDVIDRQVSHMARLLDDLLDVSRLARGKLVLQREVLPLGSVLDMAIETSQPEIERYRCHLTVHIGQADDTSVHGDPARLTQVFANLLNNAAKYNRPGGSITLTLAVNAVAREAVVTVADTGRGIAPDFAPRLFQLFAQGHDPVGASTSGLGIGLNLSRRLVELHGGSISARSAGEGQGSAFEVRLPLAAIDAARVARPATRPESAGQVLLHILVAEDHPDGAAMLAAFLREAGCRVTTVADGLAALEAAEQVRPDAVVLDIGMPGMNGYDVCARLRAEPWGREMTVVALTGWGQPDNRARGDAVGFDLHLVKPIDPNELLARLRELRGA